MEEAKQQQQIIISSENNNNSDNGNNRTISSGSPLSSEIDSSEFQSCASSEGQIQPVVVLTGEPPPPLLPVPSNYTIVTEGNNRYSPTSSSSSSLSAFEQILFFGCGVGSSLGYIATLSALVYFKMLYGPNSFVDLNLAVYLPLLPISMAQAQWDQYIDQQYQSRRTFLVRGIVAFGMILWGTVGMAMNSSSSSGSGDAIHGSSDDSLTAVIRNALWQGTGGAILYGTLNQMASFVTGDTTSPSNTANTNDGSLKATVSAGVQASALLALALSLVTEFTGDTREGQLRFPTFMWSVVAVEAVCFAMFLWLLLRRPLVAAAMLRRDYSIQIDEEYIGADMDEFEDEPAATITQVDGNEDIETPLLEGANNSDESPPLRRRLFASPTLRRQSRQQRRSTTTSAGTGPFELSYSQLWKHSKHCCLTLLATLIPSFLVGSWFTRVETDWMELASILFYVRIGADFSGRLATIWFPPRSVSCLTWTAALRMIPVVSFFLNSKREGAERIVKILLGIGRDGLTDALSIILVAVIAFQSGYLVTGCFQLAPQKLPAELREANQSKQASLLTVFFSVAAIAGLASSFTLIALGV